MFQRKNTEWYTTRIRVKIAQKHRTLLFSSNKSTILHLHIHQPFPLIISQFTLIGLGDGGGLGIEAQTFGRNLQQAAAIFSRTDGWVSQRMPRISRLSRLWGIGRKCYAHGPGVQHLPTDAGIVIPTPLRDGTPCLWQLISGSYNSPPICVLIQF